MPSLSRASLGVIIIGNDRMQPCNFPSFEKKLRVSQTRMIAAINLLAAVVVFISKPRLESVWKRRRPYASPSVKWMVTKMMNLRAFFDIYEERSFFKATFLAKTKKGRFSFYPFCKVSEIAKNSRELKLPSNIVRNQIVNCIL